MEKPGYRDNLEFLIERANGKGMLNISEVCRILDIDYRTARKLFTFNECRMISLPSLARQMC